MDGMISDVAMLGFFICFGLGYGFGYRVRAREDRAWTEMLMRMSVADEAAVIRHWPGGEAFPERRYGSPSKYPADGANARRRRDQ